MFALLLMTAIRLAPTIVLEFYVLLSSIAFLMYWRDKSAAVNGRWRLSEWSLIGIAVAGGWPGAYLARHVFRHKTRKQPFRIFFWLAVATNCGVLATVLIGLRQASG